MKTNENFDLFFKVVLSLQESTGTDPSILLKKRRHMKLVLEKATTVLPRFVKEALL